MQARPKDTEGIEVNC